MPFELIIAVFLILAGLALISLGFFSRQSLLIMVGAIIWIVFGVFTLTGQAIQSHQYTFINYTYANITLVLNESFCSAGFYIPSTSSCSGVSTPDNRVTFRNEPVIASTNTTVGLVNLSGTNANDLHTAGVIGFAFLGAGLFLFLLALMQIINLRKGGES